MRLRVIIECWSGTTGGWIGSIVRSGEDSGDDAASSGPVEDGLDSGAGEEDGPAGEAGEAGGE